MDINTLLAKYLYENPYVKVSKYENGKITYYWYDPDKRRFYYQTPSNKRNGVYEARGLMSYFKQWKNKTKEQI